eukprot:768394-Hanusia_phi.AAC.9
MGGKESASFAYFRELCTQGPLLSSPLLSSPLLSSPLLSSRLPSPLLSPLLSPLPTPLPPLSALLSPPLLSSLLPYPPSMSDRLPRGPSAAQLSEDSLPHRDDVERTRRGSQHALCGWPGENFLSPPNVD